uniref:Uncharacterized protein n=1 Tax=Anguilla anguilla TaxID=7936 RepID=A0A0E9T4S2_ANGAN
MAVFSSALFGL